MKARRKGTKKIIEVEVLRPRMYRQKDKHGRVVEDFEEGELELLQELAQSTSDHWQDVRERAAMMALASIIPMQKGQYSMCDAYKKYNDCTEEAIRYADALVEKLKGE